MTSVTKYTLPNGVRVLVEPLDHVQSASVGLWCQTGSRSERENEAGITHLIEHMLFKGTDTRSAKDIAEEIEGRGGSLNAFTDKEATCYYCRLLAKDVTGAVDVLADMMLKSTIDPVELDREESVVLEEIRRSLDEPSDFVHDLYIESRWKGHPLGKPIIGTPDSVSSFKRNDLIDYMERRYTGNRILLSVAGAVKPQEVYDLAVEKLSSIQVGASDEGLTPPMPVATRVAVQQDIQQVHFCLGANGLSLYDDDVYGLFVLDSIMGGSMSSRLFQEIREKRGLAYSIGSYSLSYSAGGAWNVYGGTSPDTWEQVHDLILSEMKAMSAQGPNDQEVSRAKTHLSCQIVLGLESTSGRMMRMSKSELIHGRNIPVEEVLEKIDRVDVNKVQELAERLFGEGSIGVATIGPIASSSAA